MSGPFAGPPSAAATAAGQQRRRLGAEAEARALLWLQARGAVLVEQNYVGRRGEIDLIMRDGEYLVFVEVRYRSQLAFVGAAASVDRNKRKAVVHTAQAYLAVHPAAGRLACRFDVLALGETDAQTEWIKNAFDASGW
jgi:putative endonuclease